MLSAVQLSFECSSHTPACFSLNSVCWPVADSEASLLHVTRVTVWIPHYVTVSETTSLLIYIWSFKKL